MARVFGAVDLGASGGRVMAGVVDGGTVELRTVHRFAHHAEVRDGHLRWSSGDLAAQIRVGLRELARTHPEVESIGIDSWGVDYGLLDHQGVLLADPVCYRDSRTDGVVASVHDRLGGASSLYAVNGLQPIPINTVYQLEAERASANWDKAEHALLIPDLLAYGLTGVLGTELTNASTTGLLDARTRSLSPQVLAAIGARGNLFPPLRAPGEVIGRLKPAVLRETGLADGVVVTTVGSHDTASAVAGVPAASGPVAFVSSGTWSLVGLELGEPVLTEATMRAGVSNEVGVDRRTLFLRNLAGLWLLQESLRSWRRTDLTTLLAEAESLPTGGPVIDVDSADLIAPGGMPARIDALVQAAGNPPLAGPAATVRCILDSLATAYAIGIHRLADLARTRPQVIHIVGGGSHNNLLCQLTANLSGLPVEAGPVEATALGNVLVQARARSALRGSLDQLRLAVGATQPPRLFRPLT